MSRSPALLLVGATVACSDLVGSSAFAPPRDAAPERAPLDAAANLSTCPGRLAPRPGRAVSTDTTARLAAGTNLHGLARDGDATVVAGSSDCPDGCCAVQLARVRDDGALDLAFGGAGTGYWTQSDRCASYWALARDDRGGFVAVGNARVPTAAVHSGVVTRFSPNGQPDAAFGRGGFVVHAPPSSSGQAQLSWLGVLADARGVVLVGADHYVQSEASLGNYARLRVSGSFDGSFGDGEVTTDPRFRTFTAVLSDGDGYVLAGEAAEGVRPALLFLDASGRPRAGIGEGGMVVQTRAMVVGAAVRDGRGGIVLGGGLGSGVPGQTRLAATRFHADGAPDTQFGAGGSWVAPVAAVWWYGLTLAPGLDVFCDGRVLVSGRWGGGLVAFRLTADGRTDESAGDVGVLDFGDSQYDLSMAVGVRVGADQSPVGWLVGRDGRSVHLLTIPSQ